MSEAGSLGRQGSRFADEARQAFDVVDLNELRFWRTVSGGETPTFKNSAILFSDWPQFLKDAYFEFGGLAGTTTLMTAFTVVEPPAAII